MGEGKLVSSVAGIQLPGETARDYVVRYCLYHFRHGFAHRSLAAGNDALTVATLMGHGSTQTLARVYAHLNQASDHLHEALRKTR